jgi:hypothetical protein
MRAFALPARSSGHGGNAPKVGMPLPRPGWPTAAAPDKAAEAAKAGERFEAMIIAQLLAKSRPTTSLAGPSPLAAGQDIIHEQTERLRAEAFARSAPLGIARALESETR